MGMFNIYIYRYMDFPWNEPTIFWGEILHPPFMESPIWGLVNSVMSSMDLSTQLCLKRWHLEIHWFNWMSKWSFSLLVKYHHWGIHHFQTKPNMEIILSNNISRTENPVQRTIITYYTQWGALFTILIKFVYNSNNYDLWYL